MSIAKLTGALVLAFSATAACAADPVQVLKATLGTGKAAADVTGQVRAIVANKGATVISSAGLSVRNPKAYFRDRVVIDYKSGGMRKSIALPNGTTVNLSQLLQMN